MQYIFDHENNVPSRLSSQWLCDNSCTWVLDVRLHITSTNEPKSDEQAKQGVLFGSLAPAIIWLTVHSLNIFPIKHIVRPFFDNI